MATSMSHNYYNQWEEPHDPFADRRIEVNGAYLIVQWSEHPPHIYRAMQPGEQTHYAVDQIEHEGQNYSLMWIEDDKEHSTAA